MTGPELLQLIRMHFPSATDQEANSVLWSCTGWPGFFVVPEGKTKWDVLREQLGEIAVKSGGVVERALTIAAEEMDAEWEVGRAEPERQQEMQK